MCSFSNKRVILLALPDNCSCNYNCSYVKVNAGVSGQTFVYPLKTAFYLCEYVTISNTVDIILQPIDKGNNIQSLRKVSLHSPENEHFKLGVW